MSHPGRNSRRRAWTALKLLLPVCVMAACAADPKSTDGASAPGNDSSAASASPTPSGPPGVLFDNFHYSDPTDPALSAHGWQIRTDGGGPGIHDTWSTAGVSFPSDTTAQGGQALQVQASTDGSKPGTKQSEMQSTTTNLFTGTFAARVYFSDKPQTGRNGDHIVETFYPISSSDSSTNYSELDYEYMPNGGWGSAGPELDTVSWFKADPPDRAYHALKEHLQGWHIMMITAVNGKATYSLDGQELFTSTGKYFPREHMDIHFSAWFIDLPFTGPRTWDMKVNWFYYKTGEAVSQADVQKAVDGFYASGTNYLNTVPKS